MTAPQENKRRACVHEAGHAVLSIKSEASNPGRVWIEEIDGVWLGRTWKPDPFLTPGEALVSEIISGWGGCQAEEVVCPPYNPEAAAKDEAEMDAMLRAAEIPVADWCEIKLRAKVRANDLAGQYEVAIEAVAAHLEEHESIDSESELIAIVERALTPRA